MLCGGGAGGAGCSARTGARYMLLLLLRIAPQWSRSERSERGISHAVPGNAMRIAIGYGDELRENEKIRSTGCTDTSCLARSSCAQLQSVISWSLPGPLCR